MNKKNVVTNLIKVILGTSFAVAILVVNFRLDTLDTRKANAWDTENVASMKGTTTTAPSDNTNINQTTAYAIEWSSGNYDSDYFSHDAGGANPERLYVEADGDYFVAFTIPMSSTITRPTVRAEVYVDGVEYDGSIGESSYLKNQNNNNESSDHVALLLTGLTDGQYIEVFVIGTADTSGAVTIDDTASLYAEFISSSRTVFNAEATQSNAPSTPTNLNQATAYELEWTEDREDTGFTHDNSTNPEDIQLDNNSDYLVYVNVPFQTTVRDSNVRVIVQLDGATVTGGNAKQGRMRATEGHNNASAHWSGVVQTTGSNQILTVQVQQEANGGTITVPTNKEASIFIEELPTTEIFSGSATDLSGGTDWNPGTSQDILWETAPIVDTTYFTHSTVTNPEEIEVEVPGDYLLVYNDSMTATVQRINNRIEVEVDGTPVAGAQTKSHYIRNNNGHNESSGSLVFLLEDLVPDQVITVTTTQEGNGGVMNDDEDALLTIWYKGRTDAYTGTEYYRWRDDTTDLNTSGGFLAAENTGLTGVSVGTTYRLRIASSNVGINAESGARTYELEWGEMVTTCEAIASWTGVADSADEFQMVATTHIAPDGEATTSALLANAEGYTRVNGEGRESADTTGSIGALSAFNYTELEYSISPTASTSVNTTYCFRLYDATAGAALDFYDQYPTLQTPASMIEQVHYRWRDDTTDLNTAGGWLDVEDGNDFDEASVGDTYRIRMEIVNVGTSAQSSAQDYELQWGELDTTCSAISTWTGIADSSDEFAMQATTHITPDGEAVTSGLLANGEGYTFINGEGRETADTATGVGILDANEYTELEFSITPTVNSTPGTTYCFRLYNDTTSAPLETYTVYPELTVEGGLKVQKIMGTLSGATSTTETILDPVASLENAFLMFDFAGGSSADNTPQEGMCSAYLSDTDEITIEKGAAAGTCNYAIYVVESLRNEFRVRGRGNINIANADLSNTGTANNLSNIIDENSVMVVGNQRSNGNASNEWRETYATLTLTNNTTVTAERGDNTGTDVSPNVRYEVVEWIASGVSVQTGETFLDDLGTADQTQTLDVDVNLSRSFVYTTFRHEADGLAQTAIRSWLSDTDELSFDRAASGTFDSYARWWVIEFPPSTVSVQENQASGGSSEDIDVTLSTINTGRSFPVVTFSNSGTGNGFPRGRYRSDLTSTNLNMSSGYSGNTNLYAYQVIDTSAWVAEDYTFSQNDFEWYGPEATVTLTDVWPTGGGPDLPENTALTQLPATNEPLKYGDQIRIQMNITVAEDTFPASTDGFKLQYRAANDCTTYGAWTDVGATGSGTIWRLYDESSIGPSTAQVNQISTSTSSAEGYFSETNPTSVNPNEVLDTENMEWDWPVENNGATDNTSYCFRMVHDNDDVLGGYRSDSYPRVETYAGLEDLMRHGNFFRDEIEQGYIWVD